MDEPDGLTSPLRAAGFRHGTTFEQDVFHTKAERDPDLRKLYIREPEGGRRARAEIQQRFKKWFVASLRIFGRPGTAGNQYCLKVGLKTRDSGDVAAAYVDSVRPVMAACGLKFPDPSELPVELPPQVKLDVP